MQVPHRWDAQGRQFREGGIQVTPRAIVVSPDDLTELGRRTVLQLGTLVVRTPDGVDASQLRDWLTERAAEFGGTHLIAYAAVQDVGEPPWMERVTVHQRDLAEGATLFVVLQVRPSEWPSLPSALQPERSR